MKSLTIASLLIIIFCSCNKEFDHMYSSELTTTNTCELCSYANSIEGSYRGQWKYYPSQITDSATFYLEHIFLGLGNSLDSSQVFFKLTKDFDNQPTQIDTVSMDNTYGIFYEIGYDTLRMGSDSILRLHHWLPGNYIYPPYPETLFNGYKQ